MKKWSVQLKVGWRKPEEAKVTDYIAGMVKKAREDRGMSQRRLSQLMDRSNAYISQIEAGKLDSAVIDLVGFAKVFDKPMKYFLPPLDVDQDSKLSPEAEDLARIYDGIADQSVQEAAIRHIKELARLDKKQREKR